MIVAAAMGDGDLHLVATDIYAKDLSFPPGFFSNTLGPPYDLFINLMTRLTELPDNRRSSLFFSGNRRP